MFQNTHTIMQDIQPEHILGSVGGIGAMVWLFSKIRRMVANDSTDITAQKAMQATMEQLREENGRMHDEVSRLRGEVNRLQEVITNLTGQIAAMSLAMSKNSVEDQLAREGKIDRRRRGEGVFDSRTKPGPLPALEEAT